MADRVPQKPKRAYHQTAAAQQVAANEAYAQAQNQQMQAAANQATAAASNPFAAAQQYGHPSQQQKQQPVAFRHPQPNMVNESFDTTTNRAGDKVNLPPSNPFGAARPESGAAEPRNSFGSRASTGGRTSTGSAGQPAYAQVQNPFQNAADADHSQQRQQQQSHDAQQQSGRKSQPTSEDALPRPIKHLNTQAARSGAALKYGTASTEFPPAPTVPQVAIDEGKSAPRFLRTTAMQAPQDQKMQQQSGVTFGLMIQPLAQPTQYDYAEGTGEVPVVDFGEDGPFRCTRCKSYVNPSFTWLQDGRKAQCNMCLFENDVPPNYYCQSNEFGKRLDRERRPELMYGTYDIVPPSAFSIREPTQPTFIFMLDCSIHSYETGFFHQALQSIKTCLESLPMPDQTRVCFATFEANLQFYVMPQDPNAEPQILQIGDLNDPFVPLPASKLLMNVTEDSERLYALIDKIYNMYGEEHYATGRQTNSVATGAAIKASTMLLEQTGGRIMLFANSLGAQGVGKVQTRVNATYYNTDEEVTKMLTPEHKFYRELALECVSKCIVVDLFLAFTVKHISLDVATMQPIAGITGGDLYLHADFNVQAHGEKLYYQIFRNLTRIGATDCMIKVRVSTGLTVSDYFGGFGVYQRAEFGLAALDQDKVFSATISNDSSLASGATCFAQCAVLHTDMNGQRKIRILNYSWNVAQNLYNYCRSSDVESVAQFKIRQTLTQVAKKGSKGTKEMVINSLVEMLTNYRNLCANQTNPTQLVLPETLTMLPLYLLVGLKKPALKMLTQTHLDLKIAQVQLYLGMSMEQMSYELYPRIYKVTDVAQSDTWGHTDENTQLIVKPQLVPCRGSKLSHQGCFIVDNGQYLTLLVGQQCPDEFLQDIFNVESPNEIEDDENWPAYMPAESERAEHLTALLEQIRYERADGPSLPIRVITTQGKGAKEVLAESLIEDSANQQMEFTYQDFLSMLHKRIKQTGQGK